LLVPEKSVARADLLDLEVDNLDRNLLLKDDKRGEGRHSFLTSNDLNQDEDFAYDLGLYLSTRDHNK
jgi:hypothetical protein